MSNTHPRLQRLAGALAVLALITSCQSFADWHADNSGTYVHTSDGSRRVDDVTVDENGYVEVVEMNGRTVPLARNGRVESVGTTVEVSTSPTRTISFDTGSRSSQRSTTRTSIGSSSATTWSGEAGASLAAAKARIAEGSPTKALADLYRAESSAPAGDVDFLREVEATWGDLRVAQGQYPKALEHYDAALAMGTIGSSAKYALETRRRAALHQSGRSAPSSWRERAQDRATVRSKSVTTPVPVPSVSTPIPSLPETVQVRARSSWGARPMRGNAKRMAHVDRITVHHSVCCTHAVSPREAIPFLKSIQTDHMDGHGWADIGYHFIVDSSGTVWEGRPLAWQGAHAGNDALNTGNIGICLLGNFDEQLVDSRQRRALEGLLVAMQSRYSVPVGSIFTHQELKSTECPGANLQRHVEEFRQRAGVFARQ